MSDRKTLKFDEYDQAVIHAVLNNIKNYHVVGNKKLGWLLMRGNKPIKNG